MVIDEVFVPVTAIDKGFAFVQDGAEDVVGAELCGQVKSRKLVRRESFSEWV